MKGTKRRVRRRRRVDKMFVKFFFLFCKKNSFLGITTVLRRSERNSKERKERRDGQNGRKIKDGKTMISLLMGRVYLDRRNESRKSGLLHVQVR